MYNTVPSPAELPGSVMTAEFSPGRRGLPTLGISEVAAAAGDDPDVLRMENLDTDIPPATEVIEATRASIGRSDANSYLPFEGQLALRQAVSEYLYRYSGAMVDAGHITITCGGTEGMLDALLATVEPGDEVILTSPTYAGMVNRVRLVGAKPVFASLVGTQAGWRLDIDTLRRAVSPRTRALLIMSPSMPTGAVLNEDEWAAIAETCVGADAWLIYNAAMERILFRGARLIHPLSIPGLAGRTLCVGSVSKEHRMIGWRIGWVTAPPDKVRDVRNAHLYNVVTPPGIAQRGAAAALRLGEPSFQAALREWERRHETLCVQLEGLPCAPADGGWSLVLDVGEMGWTSTEASAHLLAEGRIAATPMTGWGDGRAGRLVRLVFSREPVDRLMSVGVRVRRALRSGAVRSR
jgi:aspartate/methionine/tyrosine aminotransferase